MNVLFEHGDQHVALLGNGSQAIFVSLNGGVVGEGAAAATLVAASSALGLATVAAFSAGGAIGV